MQKGGYTLYRIRKKYTHNYTTELCPLVANGNIMQFPVFQINSKAKIIQYEDSTKNFLLQRLGELSFPTQGIKSNSFTSKLLTRYSEGELECYLQNNTKCTFTFDWEEILEMNNPEDDQVRYWNMQPHTFEETVVAVKKVYEQATTETESGEDPIVDDSDSY